MSIFSSSGNGYFACSSQGSARLYLRHKQALSLPTSIFPLYSLSVPDYQHSSKHPSLTLNWSRSNNYLPSCRSHGGRLQGRHGFGNAVLQAGKRGKSIARSHSACWSSAFAQIRILCSLFKELRDESGWIEEHELRHRVILLYNCCRGHGDSSFAANLYVEHCLWFP